MRNRFFFGALLAAFALAFLAAIEAEAAKPGKKGGKQETVITSTRMEYDYAESAILFEENVRVVDEEYTLTSDRMVVLLDGTNEVRQIRALGHVIVVSGDRTARCPEAVYTKKTGQIVMTGPNDTAVQLTSKDDKIWGRKITIWLDDQRMLCEPARLSLIDSNPAKTSGTGKDGQPKHVLP
jgi:lipopolysaccharide transport protein LptA